MSSSTFEKLKNQNFNKLTDSEGPSNQVSDPGFSVSLFFIDEYESKSEFKPQEFNKKKFAKGLTC